MLGVEDCKDFDQEETKKEFQESIERKPDERCQIRIPWIEGRYPVSDNMIKSRAPSGAACSGNH